MGELIELFKDRNLTERQRESITERISDLAVKISGLKIEMALYESEKQRLEKRLEE